jgi:hypothetical protein
MPKVKYIEKGGPGASVMRWRFLPDGRVLDPHGRVKAQVPDDVAYSPAAKRMADKGILDIEGYVVPKKKKATPSPPVMTSAKEEELKTTDKSKKKPGK